MTDGITNDAVPAGTENERPTDETLPLPDVPTGDTDPSESVGEVPENTSDEMPEGEEEAEGIDYAALAAEDLVALRREFPELSALSDLTELHNPARYGALRDLGLSAREAYLATEPPRRIPRGDNRAHLHSAVPKAVRGVGDGMSDGELSAARELFFGLGDAELHRLYQKVTK